SGNDLDADAGLSVDFPDEVAAILGFARCTGRGGDDLIDFVRFGDPLELRERLQRRGDGGRRQALPVESAGAQADHVFFPVDDLERQVRTDLDDDHVDRVRADVYRRDAHAGGEGVRPESVCARYTAVTLYTGATGGARKGSS